MTVISFKPSKKSMGNLCIISMNKQLNELYIKALEPQKIIQVSKILKKNNFAYSPVVGSHVQVGTV